MCTQFIDIFSFDSTDCVGASKFGLAKMESPMMNYSCLDQCEPNMIWMYGDLKWRHILGITVTRIKGAQLRYHNVP